MNRKTFIKTTILSFFGAIATAFAKDEEISITFDREIPVFDPSTVFNQDAPWSGMLVFFSYKGRYLPDVESESWCAQNGSSFERIFTVKGKKYKVKSITCLRSELSYPTWKYCLIRI